MQLSAGLVESSSRHLHNNRVYFAGYMSYSLASSVLYIETEKPCFSSNPPYSLTSTSVPSYKISDFLCFIFAMSVIDRFSSFLNLANKAAFWFSVCTVSCQIPVVANKVSLIALGVSSVPSSSTTKRHFVQENERNQHNSPESIDWPTFIFIAEPQSGHLLVISDHLPELLTSIDSLNIVKIGISLQAETNEYSTISQSLSLMIERTFFKFLESSATLMWHKSTPSGEYDSMPDTFLNVIE